MDTILKRNFSKVVFTHDNVGFIYRYKLILQSPFDSSYINLKEAETFIYIFGSVFLKSSAIRYLI